MDLFIQLVIGSAMIALTVMIHAIALDFIIKHAGIAEKLLRRVAGPVWRPLMAGVVVVSAFAAHIVQIWCWAFLYYGLHALPLNGFAETLYFATVTYTTLGYGDITLEPAYRMLSAIEGANGFLLFGWTTAFIFEVINQLYRREVKEI